VKQKLVMPASDMAVLGRPRDNTTHFAVVQEVKPKRWQSIRTWVDKPGVLQSVFPIELCRVDFFRERWGAGIYKCQWLETEPDTGKSHTLGPGRRFEVMAPAAPEPEPSAAPAERPPKKSKIKIKRSSLKAQLSVLQQLQALQREQVNAAVGERVAFIQAEAQRNREHQLELERLRLRSERDRRTAEPAPSSADGTADAVAAGIGEVVKKLDALGGGADGESGEGAKIVKMLEPVFSKIVGIVERVVIDKLQPGGGDDDDDEPDDDEPDDGQDVT
jgi:hypothetical protein